MVFEYFFAISPRKCLKKILLMSGLAFLSRSLCLRVWVDDVVCVVSLSSFFFEETKLRANRTPHTPPHVLLFFFSFLSPPLCLVRLFWPCVLFRSGFFGVPFWAPRVFLDSLGTALRPVFWTRGGRGVCSFFGQLFFPFCGCTLLDSRWSCLRPGEVAPRYCALLRRRDSDPLLCGFFLLLVFVLGHRGPRAFLFAGATVVSPRGSHTHGFFSPGLSLSLSFFLFLLCLFLAS